MIRLANEGELSLNELGDVLRSDSKEDFAVPARELIPFFEGENNEGTRIRFSIPRTDPYTQIKSLPMTEWATDQMHTRLASGLKSFAEHLRNHGMDDTYSDMMRDVLDESDATFRLRTLENTQLPERHVRAVVSDKYKPIDDDVIFGTALPLISSDRFKGIGGNKTDRRTVMKFIEREPSISVNSGGRWRDYSLGFMLGNSEVGSASASFLMFMSDSFCMNGCIFDMEELASVKHRHIGSRIDVRHGLIEHSHIERMELLSIQRLIEQATMQAMSIKGREKIKQIIETSIEQRVERDPVDFFADLGKATPLTKHEAKELPLYAYDDGLNKLEVQAAITALAKDKPYERRLELESIGGKVLTMNDRRWKALAAA